MFKKMRAALAGGASVDAVLTSDAVQPGGVIEGVVHVQGGSVDQEVNKVELSLRVVAEVERGDSEHRTNVEFGRQVVRGAFTMRAGVAEQVPFSLPVPWEMPFNVVGGQRLNGVRLGVRTDLDIARALDKGDHDPVWVHALPIHERIISAIASHGFQFRTADLEAGRVPGSSLPVYQELEFRPTGQWSRALNELEVTFITSPHSVDVLLEGDRKGGLFSEGADRLVRFSVSSQGSEVDGAVRDALTRIGQKRSFFF